MMLSKVFIFLLLSVTLVLASPRRASPSVRLNSEDSDNSSGESTENAKVAQITKKDLQQARETAKKSLQVRVDDVMKQLNELAEDVKSRMNEIEQVKPRRKY